MTYQEILKILCEADRPISFRRLAWPTGTAGEFDGDGIEKRVGDDLVFLTSEDKMANDWEVD